MITRIYLIYNRLFLAIRAAQAAEQLGGLSAWRRFAADGA